MAGKAADSLVQMAATQAEMAATQANSLVQLAKHTKSEDTKLVRMILEERNTKQGSSEEVHLVCRELRQAISPLPFLTPTNLRPFST